MRENKERPRSAALVAALATLLVLGVACHLDSLFNPRRAGRRPAGGQPGPESLVQLRSDSAMMIPTGGSVPEPSIVVRAVVRDADHSDTLALRLQVEVRPVGTALQGDPTGESNPTTSGDSAYVRVSGLADNTGYHWQARVVDQTGRASAWWSYGDNSENAADVQVGVAPNHLAFTRQPTTTTAGVIIVPPVEVTVVDPRGNTDPSFSGTISLSLYTNPSSGTLSGRTATAVNGVATFPSLSIDKAGRGYRLQATGPGVTSATSDLFDINAPPGGGAPIVLWGFNGTLPPQSGTTLGKEFNPQNPPLGSTVIATFVWRGSTNIITSVTDELWTGRQVGNTYTLVEYVTAGGISMATYVATNVQNYPYPKGVLGEELLVRAHLSTAVSAGGVLVSAWTGVNPVWAQAVGAHRSATGSGSSTPTTARPGAITVGAGGLAYAVSMATDGSVGYDKPPGFTYITGASTTSASMQFDAEYAVPTSASSLDPRWGWSFTSSHTWLATILALNPAPGP
jgi:hypothetical protein